MNQKYLPVILALAMASTVVWLWSHKPTMTVFWLLGLLAIAVMIWRFTTRRS